MIFLWFSYDFPMFFLWFSYGFPMIFRWFAVDSHIRRPHQACESEPPTTNYNDPPAAMAAHGRSRLTKLDVDIRFVFWHMCGPLFQNSNYLFSTLSMGCPQSISDCSAFSTIKRHRSSSVLTLLNPGLILDGPKDAATLESWWSDGSFGVQDPMNAAAELRLAPLLPACSFCKTIMLHCLGILSTLFSYLYLSLNITYSLLLLSWNLRYNYSKTFSGKKRDSTNF